MFSTAQLVFALIVFIAFIILMIYSYRGDKKLHKKQYKGSIWVLVGFILFILLLMAMKAYFKQ